MDKDIVQELRESPCHGNCAYCPVERAADEIERLRAALFGAPLLIPDGKPIHPDIKEALCVQGAWLREHWDTISDVRKVMRAKEMTDA